MTAARTRRGLWLRPHTILGLPRMPICRETQKELLYPKPTHLHTQYPQSRSRTRMAHGPNVVGKPGAILICRPPESPPSLMG